MAARKASTTSKKQRSLKEHEDLERRLYEVLISGRISKSSDIFEELSVYCDEMMGFCPDDEEFYDDGFGD